MAQSHSEPISTDVAHPHVASERAADAGGFSEFVSL